MRCREEVPKRKDQRREKTLFSYSWACGILFVICLSGCGYSLQGRTDLPFLSISLGKIENRTYEPRIEDRLQVALAEELMKSGFVIDADSGYGIGGVINTFVLKALSEKSGTAVQYEVEIRGAFRLYEPSGASRPLAGGGAFIVSFQSADKIEDVKAREERATEKALKDLSSELVASLLYGSR